MNDIYDYYFGNEEEKAQAIERSFLKYGRKIGLHGPDTHVIKQAREHFKDRYSEHKHSCMPAR